MGGIRLCVAVICLVILTGCQSTADMSWQGQREGQIYLFNEEKLAIEPVDLYLKDVIDVENIHQVTNYVMTMLVQGAKSSQLSPTLKHDIQLEYYIFNQGNMLLNFNSAYEGLTPYEEAIARSSLVLSLTSFNMVNTVEIVVNEKRLTDDLGKRIGRMEGSDVYTSMYESARVLTRRKYKIYYPVKGQRYLSNEEVLITLHSNKHVEELIVEYLMNEVPMPFLPEGTELYDVYVQGTMCYVNFNQKFLTNYLPEGVSGAMAIYSIVNSLTELNTISKVQILVEGKIVESFQGTVPIKTPLSKSYSLVQ